MQVNADKNGSLTVGVRDSRITRVGFWLRKYKLDELPQLINVIFGEMSLVGPRPEIRQYVTLYNSQEMKVLSVKPGITDYASIEYINESEILGNSTDPEKTYTEVVMPAKIELNMKFINCPTPGNYFAILIKTFAKILKRKK